MSYPLTLILSHQGRGKKKEASHEGARGKSSPFRKGSKGEFDFLLFRHCEEQSDMAISATSYVILMSPVFSTGRRENLILKSIYEE